MGLFSKLRNEFIDIIEWVEDSKDSVDFQDTIVWKFPRYQNEIKNGAQLTVRESQIAILINEGVIADIFQPGRHILKTENMPILSTLQGWKYAFNSPFKVDVYFVSTKQFTNKKWGTKNAIMLRDAEFGPLRLRAFGTYCFKVNADPTNFFKTIVGTKTEFTPSDIEEQLRNVIITQFTDYLAESKIPILDLAANYNEFSEGISEKLAPEFLMYGIDVTKFLIENISLPEEVEKMLDKRTSMGIVGDVNKFTQFEFANSMQTSAENGGNSMASDAMGFGMGMNAANQMMNQNNLQNNVNQAATPPPIPGQEPLYVAINGKQQGPFSISNIGLMIQQGELTRDNLVWKQGMAAWTAADQIPELNNFFGAIPPPIPSM